MFLPSKPLLTILLAAAITLPATAQRRRGAKAPAIPVAEQVRTALAAYDFELAEDLLNKEIATLKRKRQSTEDLERQLRFAQQGIIKLRATERIVIIDSVVCDKADALRAIRLSPESGRIDTYSSTYHITDPTGATIYENELANKRYLAIPSSSASSSPSNTAAVPPSSTAAVSPSPSTFTTAEVSGESRIRDDASSPLILAYSDKLGDSWSAPTPLTGLNTSDISQNFPFLLADGVTLYYAATGPESFGGYDIFVTRADGEDGSFLAPENVGFPYNSTANDYLLAIDELNQLGWFVTDRRQPAGKVCVYTFIPNPTRQLFNEDTDEATLRSRARISAIRDTWNADTEAARTRLQALRVGSAQTTVAKPDFIFPIDDTRTYTSLDNFRSPEARQKMQAWLELRKSTDTDALMLDRLRDKYATASSAERSNMANSIRRLESSHYLHIEELRAIAKDIRNAEISAK